MKKKILPAVVLLLPCLLPCTTWGAAQSEDELAALLPNSVHTVPGSGHAAGLHGFPVLYL